MYVFTAPSHQDFDVALFLTHSVQRLLAVGACLCVSCVGRALCPCVGRSLSPVWVAPFVLVWVAPSVVSDARCVGALCVGR